MSPMLLKSCGVCDRMGHSRLFRTENRLGAELQTSGVQEESKGRLCFISFVLPWGQLCGTSWSLPSQRSAGTAEGYFLG